MAIVYRNNLDDMPVEEFVSAVQKPGLDLRVRSVESRGPMAASEWLIPTAVVLYFGRAYFDGFLKEAGKDHYASVKKGLTALWRAYLSPNKELTIRLIGTPGKLDPDQRYSHIFSIYTPARDGVNRIKFLFDESSSCEVFDAQVNAVLRALEEYHTGSPTSLLARIQKESRNQHPCLVRYNAKSGELEPFEHILRDLLPKS